MEEVEYTPDAIEKHLSDPALPARARSLREALASVDPFDEAHLEATLRDTAAALGMKAGPLIHATRVAVTGRTNSPGIFEVLALLGRDQVLARFDRLIQFLATRG